MITDHVGAAGGGAGRVARVAASDHVVVDGCGGRSGENGLTWVETSIPTIRSIARGAERVPGSAAGRRGRPGGTASGQVTFTPKYCRHHSQ